MSPLANGVAGAYQVSPCPWPAFQNDGHPANVRTSSSAAPDHASLAGQPGARIPAATSTARPGTIHTQW